MKNFSHRARPGSGHKARFQGVSLIEALLALVVMSMGMLAVVGVQATLRSNGDLSRQRAEAVRLAQEDIENWRTFTNVVAGVAPNDFADIVSAGPDDVSPAGANAEFKRTRIVPADPPNGSPPFRTVRVDVQWKDRADVDQVVQLFTGVARIAPAIAASLSVPANGGPARQPSGRHTAIPRGAAIQSDGTSTYTPPQPPGPVTSLVFNNLTGLITCIKVDDGACSAETAMVLTGFVGVPSATTVFNLNVVYTQTAVPGDPERTELCYLGLPDSLFVEYFCVVRLPNSAVVNPTWSGRLIFGPAATFPASLRSCKYNPVIPFTNILQPLSNQNFLLKAAAESCPLGTTQHPNT